MIDVLAWALILAPVANLYFVYHGWRLYRADSEHSPLLAGILVAKVLVWALGMFFGVAAFRYLQNIDPVFPFGGLGLPVALVAINLLPAILHFAIRRV